LATKPISKDKYVKPEDFYENHEDYAEYIDDAEEGEEREDDIGYLTRKLSDIFEPAGKDCLVYKGEEAMQAFKRKWVDGIHEKAQAITVESVQRSFLRTALIDYVNLTHLDTWDRVVIEEWAGKFAHPMSELVLYVAEHMKEGDKLYFGAVIDFGY